MSKIGVALDGHSYTVDVRLEHRTGSELMVVVDGETIKVMVPDLDQPPDKGEWLIVGDRPYEIVVDRDLRWIRGYAGLHRLEVRDLETTASRPRSGDGRVKAPIPGHISRIFVQPGAEVTEGQPLLVLEAMKMANEVRAPRSGRVAQVHVRAGQDVSLGCLLAEIE